MSDKPTVRQALIPASILLLAAVLRVSGAIEHSFVQDELYTLLDARLLLDSPLDPGIGARPLYYLLQHLLLPLVPESELGLRILPLLFGLAGIYVTWALAREVFNHRAAAVAAILAAIAPWHLYISEMARYWSLVYLLVSVFLLAHTRIETRLGSGERRWGWIGLGSLVLGALTHPSFLFPVVGIFLFDVWRAFREREDQNWWSRAVFRRMWMPYAAFAGVAVLVFIITGEASTIQERTSRGLEPVLRLLPAVVQWISPALFAGAGAIILSFLFSDRFRWRRWGGLAAAGGGSTLLLLMASALVSEVYTDYAVGLLPIVFVSLGGVISALDVSSRWGSSVQVTVAGILVFAVLPSTVSHVIDGTRFDFRPAFEFISDSEAELPVYTSPIALQNHYAPHLNGRPLAAASPTEFEDLLSKTDYWVIAPIRRYGLIYDPGGHKRRWLVENCPEKLSYERPRFDFRMYRVRVFLCGSRGNG